MRDFYPDKQKLNKIIALSMGDPFVRGKNDCVMFVSKVAGEVGRLNDRHNEFFGTYKDWTSAKRVLKKFGGWRGMLEEMFQDLEEISPRFAVAGDPVVLLVDKKQTLAICVGSKAAAPGDNGLEFKEMRKAIRAWAN